MTVSLLLLVTILRGPSVLAQTSVWSTFETLNTPRPPTSGFAPADFLKLTAKALDRAKQWHGDALLVEITADLVPQNSSQSSSAESYAVRLLFYSPSEGAALLTTTDNLAGEVFPGGYYPDISSSEAIPEKFLDFAKAIARAHAQGMRSTPKRARLQVSILSGLTWIIWPNTDDMRTYEVAATLPDKG